jgi:hypothetical protein
MIAQATLPETSFDGNRVRDSLSALRLGHDGLEQFVGLLFDEFDALREEFESDQTSLDEERQELRRSQAKIAAERQQWETDRQHWNDALQKRVVELERDKLSLATELESERRRSAEVAKAAVEQQRHFAEERAHWVAELKQLRERTGADPGDVVAEIPPAEVPPSAFAEISPAPELELAAARGTVNGKHSAKQYVAALSTKAAVASLPKSPAFNPFEADPVMGPLMSQFQLLQRDVARRRGKKS